MVALKNAFIQGLLAVTVAAIPLAPEESSLDVRSQETYPDFTSSALVARKNPDKCEIHIHVDSSNGLCGSHCTEKYTIDIWDKPGTQICKKWGGHETGTWYATNPGNKLELPTTKGKTFWVDGRIPGGTIHDSWRNSFTLSYDTQKWNSGSCANYKFKSARASNGFRHEFDLWCEFDC
ncbi:hypothetical protein PG999_014760 [Apiospora kogelbergensis]|uniref:Secreted protein n=1 Tax=Apiospora kogelbergensis TaxID=1337665 RepID=A0AAW0Q5C9_9PEZI